MSSHLLWCSSHPLQDIYKSRHKTVRSQTSTGLVLQLVLTKAMARAVAMLSTWAVVKARQVPRTTKHGKETTHTQCVFPRLRVVYITLHLPSWIVELAG